MKEQRVTEIRAEAGASDARILVGRPVVYDQPTVIHDMFGDYTEIVKRGALSGADLSDVRLLVGHDSSRIPLARTPKTMELKEDEKGLSIRAELPGTEAGREAWEAVSRGDLRGMSYAFKVPEGGDRYDPETNTRTINRIEKVYECSLTAFPAYEQTSVSAETRAAIYAERKGLEARQAARTLINQINRVF